MPFVVAVMVWRERQGACCKDYRLTATFVCDSRCLIGTGYGRRPVPGNPNAKLEGETWAYLAERLSEDIICLLKESGVKMKFKPFALG